MANNFYILNTNESAIVIVINCDSKSCHKLVSSGLNEWVVGSSSCVSRTTSTSWMHISDNHFAH